MRKVEEKERQARRCMAEQSCALARKKQTLIKTLVNESTGDIRPENLIVTV